MLTDALTTLDNATSLTGIAAGGTQFSNVLDFSVSRDIGEAKVPYWVIFTTLPTSATGGATINCALQTSPDNVTWTTLQETSPLPLSNFVLGNTFLTRTFLPDGGLRYYRFAYTVSAALTAGAVTSAIGADHPRRNNVNSNYTI